jgi:hypothetical protein
VRGLVPGPGNANGARRERLGEYRWSSYRSYAGMEKGKSFLDSEPIQEVFQTYTGRRWKAWEYRGWVKIGLIGEIKDPFEAVKWQQVLGAQGIFAQAQRSFESKRRGPQELRTEEKLVSCRSGADP